MRFIHLRLLTATAVVLLAPLAVGRQRSSEPQPVALRDVKLSDKPDAKSVTIVMRGGRIVAVTDANEPPPADVRTIDGKGMIALPAFVDAYTFAGCVTPQPTADKDLPPKTNLDVVIDMREADRKGIQPAFRAASAFKLEKDAAKAWRSSGFGAIASSPHGQLLAGQSALATTREAASRDAFVHPIQFDCMGFEASGPGYPNSLMGEIAQLRQFLLDAQRNGELEKRRADGKVGERLPFDEDFDAIQPVLHKHRRMLCAAESAAEIERFVKLGDEFGFDVAIAGGREAWKRAKLLHERGIPVFLTLEWGDEPEDPHPKDAKTAEGAEKKPDEPKAEDKPKEVEKPKEGEKKPDEPKTELKAGDKPKDTEKKSNGAKGAKSDDPWLYDQPVRAKEEKRRLWEESRDGAKQLLDAQVPLAFGSGKGGAKDLLDHMRTIVEHGFPADAALRALTSGASDLLGTPKSLGRIEPGYDASVALWSKNPLTANDAKLAWLFVDGFTFTFDAEEAELTGKPDDGVDATGSWTLDIEMPNPKPGSAVLKMEKDGKLKGTLRFPNPAGDADLSGEFEGKVAGKKLKLTGRVKTGPFDADVTIEAELDKDTLKGDATWKWSGGQNTRHFKGQRETPKRETTGSDSKGDDR